MNQYGKVAVYRLERNGFGPFTQRLENDLHRVKAGLVQGEEIKWKKGDYKSCFLYAVDDPFKLKDYFGEFYDELISVGFEVKEYYVPPRRTRRSYGGKELAFHVGNNDMGLLNEVKLQCQVTLITIDNKKSWV